MPKQSGTIEFGAPWGTVLRLTSTLLVLVLAAASLGGWMFMPASIPSFAYWSVVGLPWIILLGSIPFVVRGYVIQRGVLLVRRLGWTTRISLMGLQSVDPNPEAMRKSIRLFGNGGGFVFAGLFRSRDLGLFRAYVNDLARAVVIQLPGRRIVVSPDNPAEFSKALRAAADFSNGSP